MKNIRSEANSRNGRPITRPMNLRDRLAMNQEQIKEDSDSLTPQDWQKLTKEFDMIGIEIRNNDHIIGLDEYPIFERITSAIKSNDAANIKVAISQMSPDSRKSIKISILNSIGPAKTRSQFGYNIPEKFFNPSKRRTDFRTDEPKSQGSDSIIADLKKRAGIT